MKSFVFTALAAFFAHQAAGHATFQQLWVNGVDQISLPRKLPRGDGQS